MNARKMWKKLKMFKLQQNISITFIDLIYGVQMSMKNGFKKNIETALSFGVPHISSYALTVEPKTAFAFVHSKRNYSTTR